MALAKQKPVEAPKTTLGELIDHEISLVRVKQAEIDFVKEVSPQIFKGRKLRETLRARALSNKSEIKLKA